MSRALPTGMLALIALAWRVGAAANCPGPPYHLPDPMWAFALRNAAIMARQPSTNYRTTVLKLEIAPFLKSFPVVRQYGDGGTVFLYVVLRSAFCRELVQLDRNESDIDSKFFSHDAILAHDLGMSPY
jgi:hypothetical protein